MRLSFGLRRAPSDPSLDNFRCQQALGAAIAPGARSRGRCRLGVDVQDEVAQHILDMRPDRTLRGLAPMLAGGVGGKGSLRTGCLRSTECPRFMGSPRAMGCPQPIRFGRAVCGYLADVLAAQLLGNFRDTKNRKCQQEHSISSARKHEHDLHILSGFYVS